MNRRMLDRLSLRLRVLLFFAAVGLGGLAALWGGLWLGYRRLGSPETLNAFVQGGIVAGFLLLGIVVWVWYLFDTHVARAIERLAARVRAHAHAGVETTFDPAEARYLGDLAAASTAAARSLSDTRNALAESVARETTRLSAEKARLEALLSDVPVGVILCNGAHQLVFYNSTARDLLGADATVAGQESDTDAGLVQGHGSSSGQGNGPGLDRPLFDYLREGPLRHAYQRLRGTADTDAASDILCATTGGARMLSARMRLLAGADAGVTTGADAGRDDAAPGYVLTLRDVTADLVGHMQREQLLAEVFDRLRRPAANLQTVLSVMGEEPPDPNGPLAAALRQEVTGLANAVTELGGRYDETRSGWWPLAMTRASDLLDGLRARIEADGNGATVEAAPLLLRCNGFEIVALLAALADRIARSTGAGAFTLALAEDGPGAMIRLSWQGAPLSVGRLDGWLAEPLDPGLADLTGRTVLFSHATEIWPEVAGPTASLCLPIRTARRAGARPAPISRAVVYDFDLLSRARAEAVTDRRLADLTYVVFDTETTGLLPSQGDEIVQLAAVRLVNGRRVDGEVFDTLVNPGRRIPGASTEVHGITEAMVRTAPGVTEVIARFHKFAEGAVLVAHNAPFDMEFLRRREAETGLRFDHPVLDTVLLSAVVFGQHDVHSLDALTHRLGVTIPEEARHTAIGDTVATADAFLRLLPMLRARGHETFGDALAEMRRHGRLLQDTNARPG